MLRVISSALEHMYLWIHWRVHFMFKTDVDLIFLIADISYSNSNAGDAITTTIHTMVEVVAAGPVVVTGIGTDENA